MSLIATSRRRESGQSLLETALVMPFLLLLALNAVNFGYYFFVALNLAAAPRHGVEYSIQGYDTPTSATVPAAGPPTDVSTISALAYADIQNSLPSYGSAQVQVCSRRSGTGTLTNPGTSTQTTPCCTTSSNASTSCSSGTLATGTAPASDPESPRFVLNRVDIVYTVTPLIAGNVFGITVLPSLSFHQQVSMREM